MKQLGCIVPVSFAALLLIISMSVSAKEPHHVAPESISCWKARFYILRYGSDAAYAWATARYNSTQIDSIRKRCSLNWNG